MSPEQHANPTTAVAAIARAYTAIAPSFLNREGISITEFFDDFLVFEDLSWLKHITTRTD
jgi:hypothetical protein